MKDRGKLISYITLLCFLAGAGLGFLRPERNPLLLIKGKEETGKQQKQGEGKRCLHSHHSGKKAPGCRSFGETFWCSEGLIRLGLREMSQPFLCQGSAVLCLMHPGKTIHVTSFPDPAVSN